MSPTTLEAQLARPRTASQRAALIARLRGDIRSGVLPPGAALPSLRELSETFGLSRTTVQAELEPLIAEGVLHAKPRHGIFVASVPPDQAAGRFVLVTPARVRPGSEWLHLESIRRGFERGASQLGGTVATVAIDDLDEGTPATNAPTGIFYALCGPSSSARHPARSIARVRYGYPETDVEAPDLEPDTVHFNDLDAGIQATRHLIRRGHRDIAFVGGHYTHPRGQHVWSRERQAGWQIALTQAFPDADLISFHPTQAEHSASSTTRDLGRIIARRMLAHRSRFDAVVCADDTYALGLADVWREAKIPRSELPPMVGFEGIAEAQEQVLVSIVPPWERIGETAAELLRRRADQPSPAPPIERLVPMHLVSRYRTRAD